MFTYQKHASKQSYSKIILHLLANKQTVSKLVVQRLNLAKILLFNTLIFLLKTISNIHLMWLQFVIEYRFGSLHDVHCMLSQRSIAIVLIFVCILVKAV